MVFIVDDDESIRRALARYLKVAGFQSEGFESAEALLERAPHPGPGCIVTDLKLPGMSGLDLQRAAAERGLTFPFVFISGHGEVTHAVQAMKDGARDFLLKPVVLEDLRSQVEAALASHRALLDRRDAATQLRAKFALLSPRERQVCSLVGEGLLNKEIAARLGTSEKTVKVQRGRATRKLGVHTTAGLVDLLHQLKQL